jgi:S-phase kinase-associated protein 1
MFGRNRGWGFRWLTTTSSSSLFNLLQVSNEGDKFEVTVEVARMAVMASNLLEGTYSTEQQRPKQKKRTTDRPASCDNSLVVAFAFCQFWSPRCWFALIVDLFSIFFKWILRADEHEEVIEIPIVNVKTAILKKVVEFCEHHVTEPMSDIEKPLKSDNMTEVVQSFYANFINVDQETLFDLILAANFMDIKPLLDLTCASVASMIKGKTPEEIRTTFNIKNDFTPEEEAQVLEENRWCEEA